MSQEGIRSLDEIMSREPATEQVQTTETPAAETEQQGQLRDERGKFATRQQEAPAQVTTETGDEAQGAETAGDNRKGKVPLQAVHAAREKERAERERADRLERELAEIRGQVSVLTRQPPQAQPQKEAPKPPPEIWENPQGFVEHVLAPVRQELREERYFRSQDRAVRDHGQEKISEAEAALKQAIEAGHLDRNAIASRLAQSVDPVGDVVRWFLNTPAQQEASLRERIRAEILAEQQPAATTAAAPTTQPAARPPMPTDFAGARSEGQRSGVTYSGPKPLSEITKGSAQ